jgi:hypothetical protein
MPGPASTGLHRPLPVKQQPGWMGLRSALLGGPARLLRLARRLRGEGAVLSAQLRPGHTPFDS